ncbi:hypothetical protein PML95_08575 [Vagococcus lutrae]|uniref:Uncharacterized protein n=2 Tax=Vagococcus lutrae TaxID=81947 RepID=A0AAE9XEU6_9ENTE|nr:hypothetical protein [Vagococcus lutrae]UQF23762.1 hypothetical protein M2909_01760 [Vagococcus lutrae]UQF64147.1 hypothetical protein M2908_09950 [Vagococcus lutrae]WCG22441.1 hypothetical protein PML95_08575 [Vagococcus lutrae]
MRWKKMNNLGTAQKLWEVDINQRVTFVSEMERRVLLEYFNRLKIQAETLIENIHSDNFFENLSYLIGIDRKLQLFFSFLNPRDFRIVDYDAERLIDLVEEDYQVYHHEQLSLEAYPLNKYSLLYEIR